MSDNELDISIGSNTSAPFLQSSNVSNNESSDIEEEVTRSSVTSGEQVFFPERDEHLTPITRKEASKVIRINSPIYNAILNNQISYSFDTSIRTPNSHKPTLDLMEQLMEKRAWTSDKFLEHTGTAELRQIPIYSGTIHQVALWSCQQMPPCLFEITAQLRGIAQKAPSLPVCKSNEVTLLIRDLVKREPVIQVIQPYFLCKKIPKFTVGQMINCVGVMLDTHLMQALQITPAGYVGEE